MVGNIDTISDPHVTGVTDATTAFRACYDFKWLCHATNYCSCMNAIFAMMCSPSKALGRSLSAGARGQPILLISMPQTQLCTFIPCVQDTL